MRNQAESRTEWVQYDTEGQIVGKIVKNPVGRLILHLEPDFQLVMVPETGRIRIWGGKNRKLIELAKNERS